MRKPITVTYDDGRSFAATLGPREFVEFERKYGVGIGALADDARMEWMFFLAYLGAKKAHAAGEHDGPIKPTFDGFLDIVAEVNMGDDPAPLDETAS